MYKGYCSEVHLKLSEPQKGKLVKLFCAVCERPLYRMPSKVPKGGKAVCPRCSKNQGENHGNFKGATYYDPKGYRHILIENHYMLEHRYIWQQANRACFVPWQPAAVHHVNFNKANNNPNNLLLLSDEEHSRVHKFLKLGRVAEAYEIMHKRALEQYWYPKEVDRFKPEVN